MFILFFKSIDDFLNNVLDIIMEADRLYTDSTPGKLIICTPYHFDDTISNVYTRALKKIIDEQLLNNVIIFFLLYKYSFKLIFIRVFND